MASRYTLGAGERLKRRQHIEALFREGKALSVFPLRLIWKFVPLGDEAFPLLAGFSAPKKKFKKAVDRNRVKRLLREAWRLNKHELTAAIPEGKQLQVFIQYLDREIPDFPKVSAVTILSIARLKKALEDAAPL